MATSKSLETSPFLLTPIDNAMPRNYVPNLLFFPESARPDMSLVVDTLRDGLSKTLEAIPLLSGTIQSVNQQGALCVTAPWITVDDIFLVKDLRQKPGPGYQDFRRRQFPLEDLDQKVVLPLARMMTSEKTVILVQVNIIKGGIIMALCLHHCFTDENGIFAISKVWAAYCRGDDGSRLVTREMINREPLMQGWKNVTLADISGFSMRPTEELASSSGILTYIHSITRGWLTALLSWCTTTSARNPEGNELPQTESGIFFFSESRLAELKSMASVRDHQEDGDTWISTNDALCALISCCMASARDKKIQEMTDRSWILWMVLGARRMLDPPLPADYIGNIASFVRLSAASQSVESTPAKVAEVAHLIRDQIKQRDEAYMRKFIGALSSIEDLTRVVRVPLSPSEDGVRFSSWAGMNFYSLDWGNAIGAKIERVRWMLLRGGYQICVIMPKVGIPGCAGEDCGLEVAFYGVEKGQIGRLKQNELYMRFAQSRCS